VEPQEGVRDDFRSEAAEARKMVRDGGRRSGFDKINANPNGQMQSYNNIFCGSEYLQAVADGKIGEDDIYLIWSCNGAQLYRNVKCDCWIFIYCRLSETSCWVFAIIKDRSFMVQVSLGQIHQSF
jgi:hypothetical protein